jgi:hypothetical protein
MPRPPRWTILLALLLGACAAKRQAEPMLMYEGDEDSSAYGLGFAGGGDGGGGYAEAPAAMPAAPVSVSAPARGRAEMSRKSARGPVAYDVSAAPPPPPPGDGGVQSGDDAPADHAEQRMVHYDGYARLRVGKLEEAADALVKLATDAGGRVENLSRTRLVLRVPVAGFRDTFARMLGLGDVLDKTITAQDVTEAFQSVELRLQSARAARERLQALLAKAKDEREKLMLIRELQRLGEEIDQLESATRTIADLASMSRVTIDLVPREAVLASGPVPETSAFGWIRTLSPFRDEVQARGKRLSLPVPAGMVLLDLRKRFVAEGPDGARVRAERLENAPQGASGFWLDAIQQRLSPEFASAQTRDVGAWKVLRLVDRSEKPYVFVLAVRAEGRHLDLVEVYYPTEAHEARYADAVQAMLVGGAS